MQTTLSLVPMEKRKRVYSAATREKNRLRSRAWTLAHPNYHRVYTPEQKEKQKEREHARGGRVRTPERRERENAARRARFAADPKHRAERNEASRAWRAAHKEQGLATARLRHYGLSREAFEILLQVQDGGCAICRTPLLRDRRTHVDHDHETNRVRGLLCLQCNMMLGLVHDSPERLLAAAEYLKRKR